VGRRDRGDYTAGKRDGRDYVSDNNDMRNYEEAVIQSLMDDIILG
jgi:hypothetical protein